MRGDKEQNCLDLVKQNIFTKNGNPILHPFTGKTYTEIDHNEFTKEQIWFINDKCHKNYFGLLEQDRSEIEQKLRIANPNVKISEFPDFVFDCGFIEHFKYHLLKQHVKVQNILRK